MSGPSSVLALLCVLSSHPASTPGPPGGVSSDPEMGERAVVALPGGTMLDLIWVPGTTFPMGDAQGGDDERPMHDVPLDGFWIGATEVTVGQWRAVMGECSSRNDEGDTHPVMDVSWEDCQAFCARTGLALPTEAQWEYAARGPLGHAFPWGNTWEAALCQSWRDRHGHERTAPVGSLPDGRSWCGVLDMAGNVFEWCLDAYDAGFYASPAARAPNAECAGGPDSQRVLRGGCWGSFPDNCRATVRCRAKPTFRNAGIGFRVCRRG
ncbi:MAG: formylglycine-generating enzyme family protein [Armatimonadetes bacterium]|nr:formylglycine-generating enzyme family protein [Armatimonadota bacterium]